MITIVVETGQASPESNSYVSPEYMEQFAALSGNPDWCNHSDKHELAMVQASAFLDTRYFRRFCGQKLNDAQGLMLPRKINGQSTPIPDSIKKAVASLALQFISEGGLSLNANRDASIRSESFSLGGGALSETIQYYDDEQAKGQFSEFAYSDSMIDMSMQEMGCGNAASGTRFIPTFRS